MMGCTAWIGGSRRWTGIARCFYHVNFLCGFLFYLSQDGCIYTRDTEPDHEFCLTEVEVVEGADITCEAEYGTSTLDISKNTLETERRKLIEEIARNDKEKVHLVETMASAEEAYVAIEEAKLKIESLKDIEQLTKIRFVVKSCSEFGEKN